MKLNRFQVNDLRRIHAQIHRGMQDPAATHVAVDALNELCQIYWHPVYSYIRSWGKSVTDAEDLTQGFFSMILQKKSLSDVASEKGKLRTFLLVALKRFLANEHQRENALEPRTGVHGGLRQ